VTRLLSGLILAGAFTLGVLFALTFRPVPAEATPPPCRTPVPVVTPTLMPTYTRGAQPVATGRADPAISGGCVSRGAPPRVRGVPA
jgi:hypothetical protein